MTRLRERASWELPSNRRTKVDFRNRTFEAWPESNLKTKFEMSPKFWAAAAVLFWGSEWDQLSLTSKFGLPRYSLHFLFRLKSFEISFRAQIANSFAIFSAMICKNKIGGRKNSRHKKFAWIFCRVFTQTRHKVNIDPEKLLIAALSQAIVENLSFGWEPQTHVKMSMICKKQIMYWSSFLMHKTI